jgi:hypothetical protein
MATLIGLCIRVKLLRSLPTRFKVPLPTSPPSLLQFTPPHPFPRNASLPLPLLPSLRHLYPLHPNALFTFFSQVDINVTPGTHASEAAGMNREGKEEGDQLFTLYFFYFLFYFSQ